ncbi:uncharacterized protein LOC121392571 [Gigantopelta aegis]|uniref:uncharacterized protein LOC121392571 n=1 Tax=Gigantopelta aegis TaxID=1735272 RepID=UPI001B88985F|nr:uncharacterized protein LOC121392571 [Gigantopelta aegis]
MPQSHRKVEMGDKSRMMAAGKYSENTLRNVNVINSLEAKLAKVKLNVLERNAIQSMHRIRHYEEKIQDLRRKTLAYQQVVAKHPIHSAPDYQKALDEKYTLHSFRHEIKEMLHKLHPDTIRKKCAQALIEASRERYQEAIHSSQQYFNSLLPPKPRPILHYDRKPQFRPSWHEEPVFVAKHPKEKNKLPSITQANKERNSKNVLTTGTGQTSSRNVQSTSKNVGYANMEGKYATSDEKQATRNEEQISRNVEHVTKNVHATKNVYTTRNVQHATRNVHHATRSDKRRVLDDRLPEITFSLAKVEADVNKEDNIKDWVNKLPTQDERRNKRPSRLESMAPQATDISTEDQSKPKSRARKRYAADKPSDESDLETPRDQDTRKQYGAHRLKRNQAKRFLTKSSDDRVHEIRNDSGYGTAESDFEITPRLREGKEWKTMQQSKKDFTQ